MKPLSFLLGLALLVLWSCDPDLDIALDLSSGIEPTAVSLIFPEDLSECTTGISLSDTESEVVFEWTPAVLGDGYILTLINLESTRIQTFETETVTLPVVLQKGTPYRWLITTTLTGSGEVTDSDIHVFFNAGPGTTSYIPFPARNIAPGNGQAFPPAQEEVNLVWESSDLDNDIQGHDVYFGNVNPPPFFSADVVASELTGIPVSRGTYYWQIITRDEAGNESVSEVFRFTIE
jgi:hypothetical protein